MNAERLLRHFDAISEAPDAVMRLRRFILDLAVRGKLVEQDAKDKPASPLLQRSPASPVAASAAKKARPVVLVGLRERPFELPKQWAFVRLGSVLNMINGRAFKPTEWVGSGLPIVRIQNLNNANAPFNFCDPNSVDERHIIRDADFLISWSGTPGTSFGAFIWERGLAALNQHIFRCVQIGCAFTPEFLKLAINSQLDVLISQAQGGVGLQHVTKGTLEALPLPLPPIEEQHRIVAKVGDLMALCDQLQAAYEAREQQRDRLVTASLRRLSADDITEPAVQQANARLLQQYLPRLTARSHHIAQLRQLILDLASCGRLVPQFHSEGAAMEFLKEIKAAKKVGQGNKAVNSPLQGKPVLPLTWATVELSDIASVGTGATPLRENPKYYEPAVIPWVTSGETRAQCIRVTSQHVSPLALKETNLKVYPVGTLIVAMYGQGKTRGQVSELCIEAATNQACAAIVLTSADAGHRRYIKMYFEKIYHEIREQAAGGAQPNLNLGKVKSTRIPLPPLAEQHRIVAKVDELMALCDQLDASLAAAQTDRSRLLGALLQEALQPAVVREDGSVRDKWRARSAISSYVVSRLSSKRSFGRTAHMKHLYLAEAHLGLELDGSYAREAAGPLDARIYDLEKQATSSGWYSPRVEVLTSGQEKVTYRPGKSIEKIVEEGISFLGPSRAEMDRVLGLMGDMSTEEVEIIATLFAVWNDALIDSGSLDDEWIVKEVREHWHKSKQRFIPAELKKWLAWMRANDLVPAGRFPRTIQQTTLDF